MLYSSKLVLRVHDNEADTWAGVDLSMFIGRGKGVPFTLGLQNQWGMLPPPPPKKKKKKFQF